MSSVFAAVGSTYVPPLSVWDVIAENVCVSEHQEMRKMIGEGLIDTAADLRSEALTLFDILNETRSASEASSVTYSILPESDELRSRLRSEIVNLVEMLKDKAQTFELDVSDLLKSHNRQVIDYAYDTSSDSRPNTSSNRSVSLASASSLSSAAQTPRQASSSDSVRCESRQSSAARLTSALQKKVNYMSTGPLLLELRSLLDEEVSQLHADIRMINNCLERAMDADLDSQPSLAELKLERNKLQKEVITDLPMALRPSPSESRMPSAAGVGIGVGTTPVSSTKVRRDDSAKSLSSSFSERARATLLKSNQDAASLKSNAKNSAKATKPLLSKKSDKPSPTTVAASGHTGASSNPRVSKFRNMVIHCRQDAPS